MDPHKAETRVVIKPASISDFFVWLDVGVVCPTPKTKKGTSNLVISPKVRLCDDMGSYRRSRQRSRTLL